MYYQLFNQTFIQQQAQKQYKDIEQSINVMDSSQKLKDFLDSLDRIDADYQAGASICFCSILYDYLQKNNI